MASNNELTMADIETLSAYIDGMLPEPENSEVEARLQTDAAWREEYQALRQTVAIVRQLPELKAPRNFTLTREMIADKAENVVALPRKVQRKPYYGWVTSAAASVILLFSVVITLSLSNQDVQNSVAEVLSGGNESPSVATFSTTAANQVGVDSATDENQSLAGAARSAPTEILSDDAMEEVEEIEADVLPDSASGGAAPESAAEPAPFAADPLASEEQEAFNFSTTEVEAMPDEAMAPAPAEAPAVADTSAVTDEDESIANDDDMAVTAEEEAPLDGEAEIIGSAVDAFEESTDAGSPVELPEEESGEIQESTNREVLSDIAEGTLESRQQIVDETQYQPVFSLIQVAGIIIAIACIIFLIWQFRRSS